MSEQKDIRPGELAINTAPEPKDAGLGIYRPHPYALAKPLGNTQTGQLGRAGFAASRFLSLGRGVAWAGEI